MSVLSKTLLLRTFLTTSYSYCNSTAQTFFKDNNNTPNEREEKIQFMCKKTNLENINDDNKNKSAVATGKLREEIPPSEIVIRERI